MLNGNGRATLWLTIATFLVGIAIGVMGTMIQVQNSYVSKEEYREDIRRLEHSIESVSADVKRLLERR